MPGHPGLRPNSHAVRLSLDLHPVNLGRRLLDLAAYLAHRRIEITVPYMAPGGRFGTFPGSGDEILLLTGGDRFLFLTTL